MVGIQVYLSYVKRTIMRAFDKYKLKENFDYKKIFPTTHEAVLWILHNSCVYKIKVDEDMDNFESPNAEDDIAERSDTEDAIVRPVFKQRKNLHYELESIVYNSVV